MIETYRLKGIVIFFQKEKQSDCKNENHIRKAKNNSKYKHFLNVKYSFFLLETGDSVKVLKLIHYFIL